ncbi:HTTM domain protein [Halorubrum californiense DSM 19288]|uniref:HTTM domain protein n=1 Tax=Halorubrum californiense DSM 19288 TaxID=1227465 RepID=M0ECN9_9EURY|nr:MULTISPECIES: HTTM domain-containing protein [Halorubrum]ELZ44818.1 HTTM domain protein [Halorubrum californiense DSM 19288]TKX70695.1 HTTM domain-containing protein [Halorubrum sp. GN11GM_10-3_MGM]
MTPPSQPLQNAGSRYAAARESVRERAAPHFGIDPRALGAFRIAVALFVLADLLIYRLPAVGAFYVDGGVLPRSTLAETFPLLSEASLYAISGAAWVQTGLLAVAVLAAGCLLVGYRTRAATGLSLILLASLYARNPYVINGGNTILVVFLLLSLFLPLDARWSLGTDPQSRLDSRICSVGTAVTLLTLVSIYAANAVSKYRSDAWVSGVAVPRIFQLGEFTVGLGPLFSEQAAVLTAINWSWIALLSVSPVLVVATGRLRTAATLAFVAAHLGMAATMRLGVFPFVMAAILLLFLPPEAWDRVEAVTSELRESAPLTGPDRTHRSDGGTDPGAASPTRSRARRGIRVGTAALLVGFFLALVWWQAAGVGLVDLPASESTGELSEVSWSFFAPNPPDASSWYVVSATLESGDSIDLRDGGAVTYDRPPDAAETYPTTLWNQFGFRMKHAGESRYRPVASYLCERTDRDVTAVSVFHVEQAVDADGPVGEPEAEEKVRVAC